MLSEGYMFEYIGPGVRELRRFWATGTKPSTDGPFSQLWILPPDTIGAYQKVNVTDGVGTAVERIARQVREKNSSSLDRGAMHLGCLAALFWLIHRSVPGSLHSLVCAVRVLCSNETWHAVRFSLTYTELLRNANLRLHLFIIEVSEPCRWDNKSDQGVTSVARPSVGASGSAQSKAVSLGISSNWRTLVHREREKAFPLSQERRTPGE
jgi:hypothetical protein